MYDAVVIGGIGMVGNATMETFGIQDYYDLRGSNIDLMAIAEQKRYVFMALPTPTKDGQQGGVDDMEQIIKEILGYGGGQKIFIIRSTVLPGTTKRLIERCGTSAIVHNPEFLTEDTWEKDCLHPDIVVIGADDPIFRDDVEALYKSRFRGATDIIKTDSMTSETIKYAINTLYATKVVFANQLYDFCEKFGVNYEKVKEAMYKRKWIGKNHLRVFDTEGKRGAGGGCLAKDLDVFAQASGGKLLELVNKLNKDYLQK